MRHYPNSGGVAAPVLSGTMPPPGVDRAARKALPEELGHSRIAITSAYIGSVPKLDALARKRQARLAEREALLAADPRLQALAGTRAAVPALAHAGARPPAPPPLHGQLTLDFDWPTA